MFWSELESVCHGGQFYMCYLKQSLGMCGEIAPQHSSGWKSAWPGLSTACSWGLLETSLSVAAARHSGWKEEDPTSDLLEDQGRAFFRFQKTRLSSIQPSLYYHVKKHVFLPQWRPEKGTGMCYNVLDVGCPHPCMCTQARKLGVLYRSWLTPLRQSLSLDLELLW